MCVLHDCTAVDVVAGQSCYSIVALVVLVMELFTGTQVIRLILSSLHEVCQNYGILKGTLVQSLARVKRMHGWPLGLVVLFWTCGMLWYGIPERHAKSSELARTTHSGHLLSSENSVS